MDDKPLKPGTPVRLHGYVERHDEHTDTYLIALQPVGMGVDDPERSSTSG